MANGSKVVLNRRVFGEQVMASQAMANQLRPAAQAVADKVPGSEMRWIVTKAAGGGSRGRWRIEAPHTAAHQTRQQLVSAIRSVLSRSAER